MLLPEASNEGTDAGLQPSDFLLPPNRLMRLLVALRGCCGLQLRCSLGLSPRLGAAATNAATARRSLRVKCEKICRTMCRITCKWPLPLAPSCCSHGSQN